ncbi:hypothetical protein FRC17_010651 [Serendipita sp. 399]|nr:hypothetical protein FRC17_010651 [Serendipita sp. 399]
MTNITQLPEEILLHIVQELAPEDENYITNLEWTRQQCNWWNMREDTESSDCYSTLISLSYTNRCFYRLCVPTIYSKVDLYNLQDYRVAMNKTQYVQCLRISIGDNMAPRRKLEALDIDRILFVLGACANLNNLVIIYEPIYREQQQQGSSEKQTPVSIRFTSKIVSLLESGQLKTLAVSSHGMGSTVLDDSMGPLSLLSEIRSRVPQLRHDQQVHLAAFRCVMPRYAEKQIYAPTDHAPAINRNTPVYFPPTNLVSLKFMSSGDIHAPHLPDLVLHCPQLRYLFVSECGAYAGLRHIPRPSGWSTRSDALWRQREPLEEFHIEHMLEWEILAMGTIPARKVIITSLIEDDLQKSFLADPEIFPGLSFLRYEPRDDMPSGGEAVQKKFHDVLKQREIQWKADAVHLYRVRWRYDAAFELSDEES